MLMKKEIGNKTLGKIKMLAGFLEEKYALSLARAVSVNPAKMEKILSGEDELSIKILNKIAAYFFIPLDLLIDDEKKGKYIFYTLNTTVLDDILKWMMSLKGVSDHEEH